MVEDQSTLDELVELGNMPGLEKQDLKFKGIDWELKRYASFTVLSEELYDDTDVDLVKFFKEGRKD